MKVVVEYVLIENLIINLIILKTTSLICKEKCRLSLLSSFLGACLTVALPALRLKSVGHILVQIGQTALVLCISLKFSTLKKFFCLFVCYFISAFAYGGAVYFFESLMGQEYMIATLLIVLIIFALITIVYRKIKRKADIEKFCYEIKIINENNCVLSKAFLDSGNLLTDPITKLPVCLINFNIFEKICSNCSIEDVLTRSKKLDSLKLAHYINFSTLNNSNKIFVFQVDQIKVGEKCFDNAMLGLCYKNFNQTFGTDVILHNNFA